MKNLLRILPFVLCGFAGTTLADDFKSQFISASSLSCPSCPIHVDDEQFLLIRNFTQDGMTSTRGSVTFQRHGETVVTVLTASIVDQTTAPSKLEVINSVVIAGPASVNVSCGDAPIGCFFSYKKESN